MRTHLEVAAIAVLLLACGRTGLLVEGPAPDEFDSGPIAGSGAVAGSGDIDRRSDPDDPPDRRHRDCTEATSSFIYVIAESRSLYRFDPESGGFEFVGTMSCSSDSAFSMAVDRRGTAYVLLQPFDVYPRGELYRVSTVDASCSRVTEYEPDQLGFGLFGMGFASNQTDSGETLYVAGAAHTQSASGLATLDTTTFELSFIGANDPPIDRIELTGTGDGRLFAFLAYGSTGPLKYLAELDKTTGRVLSETELTEVASTDPGGWAVAHFGGDFFFFTDPAGDAEATRYRPTDGSYILVGTLPGERIVGAGVTTCVPP